MRTPADLRTSGVLLQGPITAKTATKRAVLYRVFQEYMGDAVPEYTVDDLVMYHHFVLAEWVAEFVLHAYMELAWSRGKTAELVLAIKDRHPAMSQVMGGAWRRLQAWSSAEPAVLQLKQRNHVRPR